MAFDINQTLDDMLGAIAGVVVGEWPKVKSCVEKVLQDEKSALEAIAQARLNKEIDDEEMRSQMEDEKVTLEASLLVCQIKAKVMAQKAANAAMDVLRTAIETALKVI